MLRGGVPMAAAAPPYDFTWAFVLAGQEDGTTRLIVRERYAYTRWWSALLVEPVEAISFVMSQKMLRGIRDAAEKPQARSAPMPMAERPGAATMGACPGHSGPGG